MAKTTQAQARAQLKAAGCVLAYDPDAGEYRVNFKGGKEATAYYTNDIDDAVNTGTAMALRKSGVLPE